VQFADYNSGVQGVSGVKPKRFGGTISVHGMNTRGKWQRDVSPLLQDGAFRDINYDYGNIKIGVALPCRPAQEAEILSGLYREQIAADCPHVSLIGHSFGTRIIGAFIERYPDLKLHRVILRSAVLRRRFTWSKYLVELGQADAVLNEYCPQDYVPLIARCAFWKGGSSGRHGFLDTASGRVLNRGYNNIGHSGRLDADHCQQVWLKFLRTGDASSPFAING
jgi:pimeloyl-ACP methyl ester carboxylesterase